MQPTAISTSHETLPLKGKLPCEEIQIRYDFSIFRGDEGCKESKDTIQGAALLDKQKTLHLRRYTMLYVQKTEHHMKDYELMNYSWGRVL